MSGDYLVSHSSRINLMLVMTTSFVAGQDLRLLRKSAREYALKVRQTVLSASHFYLAHTQAAVLMEGLQVLESSEIDGVPNMGEYSSYYSTGLKIQELVRALLFRRFDKVIDGFGHVSEVVSEKQSQLR